MEKSKIYVIFGVLSLVISLVAVSLAYAGFSSTLNIDGGVTSDSKWDIHFINLKLNENNGVIIQENPSIKYLTTVINGSNLTFESPNSSISYTFEVENKGNLDASFNGLYIGNKSCDDLEECDNIDIKLYDIASDMELIEADNSKILSEVGKKSYRLVISYNGEKSNITLNDLSIVFNFIQES